MCVCDFNFRTCDGCFSLSDNDVLRFPAVSWEEEEAEKEEEVKEADEEKS